MKASVLFELGPLKAFLKTPYLYRRLAFSADGRYLALSGRQESEEAFVWELASRKLLRPPLTGASFLKFLGTSSILMGSQAKMWDIESNKPALPPVIAPGDERCPDGEFRRPYFDFCMDTDPAGQLVLGAPLFDSDYYYLKLGLWEIKSGQLLRRFNTPPVRYNAARVRFSPDGQWFSYVARLNQDDQTLNITTWEVESGRPLLAAPQNLVVGMDDFDFQISLDGLMLSVAEKFYRLDKTEGAQLLQGVFDYTDTRVSRRLLSSQQIMEVNPDGELAVYNAAGNQLASLELEYVPAGKNIVEKLVPRVFAAGPNLYAAADDRAVLVWRT